MYDGGLDVAFLCVVAFFLFFLGLVYHLRQEDKREGYPLELTDAIGNPRRTGGFPPVPKPKLFYLPHGKGTVEAPRAEPPMDPPIEDPRSGLDGYPIDPGTDPLSSGIGPATWQRRRSDGPDLDVEGDPKIVPLSRWQAYYVAPGDVDPRGFAVVAADGVEVGRVTDLWFNRAEFFLRYLEMDIGDERTRLVPLFFSEVSPGERQVRVNSLAAHDLLRAPASDSPDIVSLRDEDRINGFFAGGNLYSKKRSRR